MGLMVQVIWQLINLCTIAVLPVSGSLGSIVQFPAASPPIKSPILHQTIIGPLSPLLSGQSTTLAPEHTLAAAVPAQPFLHSAAPVTAETPHGSPYRIPKPPHDTVPPLPEETPHEQLHVYPPPAAEPPLISSVPPASDPSHGSTQAPASNASPALALPPAMRPPEAIAPLPHVNSSSSPPLISPFFPSPPVATKLPHTSSPTMAAMPPISVAPIPFTEPPSLEGQPFFHSPSPASPPDSPPATIMVSPPVSPPLPDALSPMPQPVPLDPPPPKFTLPSHTFVPPTLTVPLPPAPPPTFLSPPHTLPPYASTLEPPQLAPLHPSPPDFVAPPHAIASPPLIEPLSPKPLPILASPPHASPMPFPPFPSQASPPPLEMVPSHASPPIFEVPSHALVPPPLTVPPLPEPPPIIPSPLHAEPPHASAMSSPPLLSDASSPMSQPVPLGSPPPKFTVPSSHTFAPPPLTVPLPPELPPTFVSPTHTLPPYASTMEPPLLAPLHPSPPDFVAPPYALVPPPLKEPLSPESSPVLASPPVPPHASSMLFPPFPSEASPPQLQMVPSHASPPTFEVTSHAFAPPPLMTPLPKGPPPVLPIPQPTMPPRASTLQSPPTPPLESSPYPQAIPPQASPATLFVPPPSARPPHSFSMLPPIELPHTYPPPLTTLPGEVSPYAFPPVLVSPPLAPAPLIMPYPPHEKSHSYAPHSTTMQGTAPSVLPHVSHKKELQNGTLPPVPTIESSPSSRISPRGGPSVHQIRSHPPISHQIEAPNPSSSSWRSNASAPHPPPLPSSAPSNNTTTSEVPLSAPPSYETISSRVPLAAPPSRAPSQLPLTNTSHHGSATILAPQPFSSYVHPPGISPFISPSIPNFTRPSSLAPMPVALSPQFSTGKGSHSSVASPSPSTQKHPRDDVRSLGPASVPVPSPAPSQLGQAESPSPHSAPKASPVVGQKYNPSSPPSQGSPTSVVPLPSPSRVPEISPVSSSIPFLSPKISPSGSSTRNTKRPLAQPIRALPPPPPNQDCEYLTCMEPLTNTPPGSPCGCVQPMQVGLRLGVTLYTFFPSVSELAREIATGVSMSPSQVRVMGANSASQEPEKTIVIIDLVPLNNAFDYTTAMSTSQKFWHQQVAIDKSMFGDYDVIYVHYPGLPPSPPIPPSDISVINGMPYSVGDPNGGKLHPLAVDVPKQKHKNKLNGSLIAVIVFSAIVGLLICGSVAWVLIFRRARLNSQSVQTPRAVPSLERSSGPTGNLDGSEPSSPLSFGSSLAAYKGSARTFRASEMEKATDNFNPSGILGEGGFGFVYRGILEDGTGVAVKVPKRDDQRGGKEFLAEVEMLSRLHHRNLVKLIGICIEERMHCLVYELVPNGSVDSHLHGPDKGTSPLDWTSRLKIALGAARGLAYLHEDSSPRVIHRDFKASNILLESDFTPKVSDFGLARNALDEENRHISTHVMGTFGYVAPEYAMTGHLLVKSDVYSYGVVLLELLTGRKPVDMSQPSGQENLVAWTRPLLTTTEGLESIVDTSLGSDIPLDSVAKVAAIASMCVQPEVSHRPFMGEVVQALKLVCDECDDSKDGEEDSRNLSRENLSIDFDTKPGTSPHAGETPKPLPSHGFTPRHDLETGLSVSEIFSVSAREGRQSSGSLHRHSASGPIRTTRGQGFWKRIKRLSEGSVSENGIMYRSSWSR